MGPIDNPNRLVLLARKLDRGGAERQLVALAKGLKRRDIDVHVFLFYKGGAFEAELIAKGLPVYFAEKKGRWDIVGFLWRLFRQIRKLKPTILHSYLGVPNILAAILKLFFPKIKIVWGVRGSDRDLSQYDWLVRLSYRLECFLSPLADLIISNSRAGQAYAVKNGFPENKLIVIPNGIDTNIFQFSSEARRAMRQTWGIDDDTLLIGLVGRLDPVKGHNNFLKAARLVLDARQNVRFLCVGSGQGSYANHLKRQAAEQGLETCLAWLPAQEHMPPIYSGLDIICSSSISEGFSNVLAEAMACEGPCVATDVGDSRILVGEAGLIVPPGDEIALAAALLKLAALSPESRRALGQAGRKRIIEKFSVESLVANTVAALSEGYCFSIATLGTLNQ